MCDIPSTLRMSDRKNDLSKGDPEQLSLEMTILSFHGRSTFTNGIISQQYAHLKKKNHFNKAVTEIV